MPMYYTYYNVPGVTGSAHPQTTQETQVWAKDESHLVEVMEARKLGEWRSYGDAMAAFYEGSTRLPSEWLELGNIPEALHAANWLCMVAVKAGVIEAWEVLHDNGAIHGLSHLNLPHVAGNNREDVLEKYTKHILSELLRIEAITPGFNKKEYKTIRNPVQIIVA